MLSRATLTMALILVGLWVQARLVMAQPPGSVVPDQYIVVLVPGASPQAVAQAHGLAPTHVYSAALNGFAATIPPAILPSVLADPSVLYVEPDVEVEAFPVKPEGKPGGGGTQPPQTLPTGINRIDADLSATAKIDGVDERVNADIAIIDTGIYSKHPDLDVTVLATCVIGEGFDDQNGHGTHVAGTAAALDSSIGVVGVAPGARLWSVKVLNKKGFGFMSWVICGIDFVTQNASAVEVANMSLGCECSSSSLDTALSNSVAKGVVYAVAAGNSSKDAATFSPANHPEVLAVSAIADSDGRCGGLGPETDYGTDDTFASFSNFGSVVDLAAPGVNILSTYKGSTYATGSGTSMASPHVAGTAALYLATRPKPTDATGVAAVRNALISAGVPQNEACTPTLNNGYGGFSGDPSAEPLDYAEGF